MSKDSILKFQISKESKATNALEQLNEINVKAPVLFVMDNNILVGTLSDGDIRRGLLNKYSLDDTLEKFMRSEFRYIVKNDPDRYSKYNKARELGIEYLPILNDDKSVLDILNISESKALLPLEAVIMAGGLGSRLLPLTEKTPKPLLEVGGKPIIQHNVDRLKSYGIYDFNITVRYLGEQIESHFENDEHVKIVTEKEPLGTIGAVQLIDGFNQDYVLIMNSDLLTNIDYEDMFKDFIAKGADMAVATVPYDVSIPYAVLEIDDDRKVNAFKEKPTYTYYSNAGIYLLKKELLSLINKGGKFDATDFMNAVIDNDHKLISFPIRGYWLDIGKHDDFNKAQRDIHHIKF